MLDEQTGQLLARPYVLKTVGDTKIAIIGLSEAPAGMDFLPHLKEQLAGVRIRPPVDALSDYIPQCRVEASRIVLLYYGTAAGVRAIREKFASELAVIAVGGLRPEQVLADVKPPILAAEEHGKDVAMLKWNAGAAPDEVVTHLAIDESLGPDPAMRQVLAAFPQASAALSAAAESPPVPRGQPVVAQTQASPARVDGAPGGVGAGRDSVPPVSPPADRQPPAGEGTGGTPAPAPSAPSVAAARTSPSPPEAAPKSPRISAHQDRAPQGITSVGLTADQVNYAIDHGSEFLWHYLQSRAANNAKPGEVMSTDGENILCALALLHCNAQKRFPEFDADIRAYLTRVNVADLNRSRTYETALLAMVIESYGDETFLPKLQQITRYLIEAQGTGGSWAYSANVPQSAEEQVDPAALKQAMRVVGGAPPPDAAQPASGADAWSRHTPWTVGRDGDTSNTQYAVLALNTASRVGIHLDPDIWKRALKVHQARQNDDGGTGYYPNGGESYGSMTCAAICAAAICRHELGEKDPAADEGIERGLGWLSANFSVTRHPAANEFYFYYMYSVERVGRLLDTEFIGDHEWYPLGAKELVGSQQKDGRWQGIGHEEDPRIATSFALLFLTRATPGFKLPPPKHGGTGTLKTSVETPPPKRLYIILDASGSMLDIMDGKKKFDVARNAVKALVDRLPDSTEVALRVYGHRKRSIEEGSDEDTALEIPMGPLDRKKFAAKLQSLRPRGKTPLALSLQQAQNELGASEADPVVVVLLTDGGEDTMPRRDPVKAADAFGKLKGVTFHIVGFDINQEAWSVQLKAMARRAGARYWPAPHTDELEGQVIGAIFGTPESFSVLDKDGHELRRGRFGESVRLAEGTYTLKTAYGGSEFSSQFQIGTDATTCVFFDASRVPIGAAAPALPVSSKRAQP